MKVYIVRNTLDEEFIDGEFNESSILGIFSTKDYFTLFQIVNEAIDAFTLAFTELPPETGVFFTRGGEIEFEAEDPEVAPISFDSNLIEITESLGAYLNEGVDWKMWIMKREKIWWTHVEKPYLLN
jgi:hypothetical protein